MTSITVDLEELRSTQHQVITAIEHLHRARSVAPDLVTAPLLLRTISMLEEISSRLRTILTSSFFVDTTHGASRILAVVDRSIADPKWWNRATTSPSTPIDDLMPIIIGNTEARDSLLSRAFLEDSSRVAALLFGSTNFASIERFWLAATSPDSTDPTIARFRIESVARAIFDEPTVRPAFSGASLNVDELHRRRDELRALLGAMAAPWQLHFTGLCDLWGGDREEGLLLLRRIAADRRAAEELALGLEGALIRAFATLPDTHDERMQHIDDVAFAIGVSTEVLRGAAVDRARSESARTTRILSIPTKLPLGLPWPASLGLSSTIGVVASNMDHTDDAADNAEREEARQREQLARLAGELTWKSAVDDGLVVLDGRAIPVEVQLEVQHAIDSIANATGRGDSWATVN